MTAVLHAEWTKVRTIAGPAWLLASTLVLTVAIGLAAVSGANCAGPGCGLDPARISFTGVYLSQALVAMLGVLAIGSEYSTGMITVSLTAMPRRTGMLAAKAAVLTGPVLITAAVMAIIPLLAGRLILPGHGFTAANGYGSLWGAADWRAAAGTALYLTLIALLSLGVATALRDPAAATGTILGLLYLFPIVAALVPSAHLRRFLDQVGPMSAGLDVETTVGVRSLPLAPWQGLGVTALWAAAALILGAAALCLRDA